MQPKPSGDGKSEEVFPSPIGEGREVGAEEVIANSKTFRNLNFVFLLTRLLGREMRNLSINSIFSDYNLF